MPILRRLAPALVSILAVLAFCSSAGAQDSYEIFFDDGTSVKTPEYFEDGGKVIYEAAGAPVEVDKSRVKEIRDLTEFQGAETVDYDDGAGNKASTVKSGSSMNSAGKDGKKAKKKLTADERREIREMIKKSEEYLARIKKCGKSCFMADSLIGMNTGKGFATADQLYQYKVRETENRIKNLKKRLREGY